ncbi:MAG: HAD family hydrolase [Rhodospirillales bacterium]|jgi:2-haloacid dehalogenase
MADRRDPSIVVFDLGGVLLDWNPRHLYGKLIADTAAMEDFLATVCTSEWNLEQDRGRDWDEAVRLLADRFPDHAELIAAYHLRWEEMIAGPVPGTKAVLQDLQAREVPTYAITNFSAPKLDLARRTYPEIASFRGIVVSGEVGLLKPEPEIYRRLFDDHRLAPGDTVFIDDVQKNVDGAKAVGMHALLFTDAARLRKDLEGFGLL